MMKRSFCILSMFLCLALASQLVMSQNAPVSTVGTIVTSGMTATVPIMAINFNNIASCNLELLYNSAVVSATGITTGPLLGGSLSMDLSVPGTISLGWYTYPGETLPDNTVIFNIAFTSITGGTSAITWFDNGNSCIWFDVNFQPLIDIPTSTYYINGSVTFPLLTGSASVTTPITCHGGTATVTMTAGGGTPPYTYTFNGVSNGTGSFPGILAGTAYAWSITDVNNNGPVTGTLNVLQPPLLTGSATVTTPIACFGGNGTVTMTAGGGTSPYTYTFNGVTNSTGIFTVIAGTYSWSVTDNNNCVYTGTAITIPQPPQPQVSVSISASINPLCAGTSVIFTAYPVNGGTTPYYQWYIGNLHVGSNSSTYTYAPVNGDLVSVIMTASDFCQTQATSSPVTMTVNTCNITGTLEYDNTSHTRLTNMIVTLNSTPPISSAPSGSDGFYTISGVPSGNYTLSVNANGKPVGGINATDAAQVNYWSTGSNAYTIDLVRFFAGDAINNYSMLFSADASAILAYFVDGLAILPPWKFWLTSGTISSNNYTGPALPGLTISSSPLSDQNFYGMCTGDFNQSFNPGTKEAGNNLSLTYGATLQVRNGDEFDLPVSTQSAIDVGAVSLIMNFPSDKLEIMGVTLADKSNTPVMYNASGDELKIGWYSRDDLSLKAGDKLLTLRVKLLASLDQSETIRFTLAADPLNELADAMGTIIPDAILNMDLVGSTLGINPGSGTETLNFTNYPNPFTGTTTLAYSLPVNGAVTIELRNTLGVLDKVIVNNIQQTSGDYKLILDGYDLPDGVYIATLKLISANQIITRTIKIVRTY